MTSPLNKLNKYDTTPRAEQPYTKKSGKTHAFERFQWVLDGKLARSARPYYTAGKGHTVERQDTYFLATQRITCVISVNETDMDVAGRNALARAGIAFHSFQIPDFHAPTAWELWEAARLIAENRTTLVYCGYGQGRTGTVVAAWAKLRHKPAIKGIGNGAFLKENFGVEAPCQVQVLNTLVPNGPQPPVTRTVGGPAGQPSGLGMSGGALTPANFGSGFSKGSFVPPFIKSGGSGFSF